MHEPVSSKYFYLISVPKRYNLHFFSLVAGKRQNYRLIHEFLLENNNLSLDTNVSAFNLRFKTNFVLQKMVENPPSFNEHSTYNGVTSATVGRVCEYSYFRVLGANVNIFKIFVYLGGGGGEHS